MNDVRFDCFSYRFFVFFLEHLSVSPSLFRARIRTQHQIRMFVDFYHRHECTITCTFPISLRFACRISFVRTYVGEGTSILIFSTISRISAIPRTVTRTIRRTAVSSAANSSAAVLEKGVCGAVTLQSQIGCLSQNGKSQLQILAQPEQQHRARYQTEGSRGAVKDRSGNGFPIVKLTGYNKPAVLQVDPTPPSPSPPKAKN